MELIYNISVLLSLLLPYVICWGLNRRKIIQLNIDNYIITYWILVLFTFLLDEILFRLFELNVAFSSVIGMSSGVFMILVTMVYLAYVLIKVVQNSINAPKENK